jgi:hypothetical protein
MASVSESPFAKREVRVPTITLNDLLRRIEVESIDFLSMDIELGEPEALAGFDIQKYRPELVCIEAHQPVRAAIRKYFRENGYDVIDRYAFADLRNWYFTPSEPQESDP